MDIVLLILGVIIGLIFMYLVLRPKLQKTQEYNYKIEEQNEMLQQDKEHYEKQVIELRKSCQNVEDYLKQKQEQVAILKVQEEEIQKHQKAMLEQINQDNDLIYQKSYDLMQEKLSQAATEESEKFQKCQKKAQEEYLRTLEEMAQETAAALALKLEEISSTQQKLDTLRAKADAAIAAAKREEEMKRNPEDYCIHLEKSDKVDIARMIEFSETLNNPRALLMCIWTSFIRTPLRTLCNNIFGNDEVCGIYKLTINNQFYIGQSVHCKERMSEHFKKALGIDTPTTSKLYNYLTKHNIWDIQIEFLEECKPEELNDREKFFIELFSADKSLNSTGGNRG